MAEHIRTTVRKAIAAQLAVEQPTLKIYAARSRPMGLSSPGELVEILVPRERALVQANHSGGLEYIREIEILLIGYHAATSDDAAADGADLLALNLETAIHSDLTLGNKVQDMWLTTTDFALDAAAYANASFSQSWTVLVAKSLADMNI